MNKAELHAFIAANQPNICQMNSTVIAVTSYFKPTIFDRVDFIQQNIEPWLLGQ